MFRYLFFIVLIFTSFSLLAQDGQPAAVGHMRPVEELINKQASAWGHVKDWIDSAKNKVEILPCDSSKAREALYQTQVTTHSPMGAIVYSTGGLLIDGGWLRILGSGNNDKMKRTLPGWNKGKTFNKEGERPLFLLVADDAAGGFFAINGGKLGKDVGKVYYLSPDILRWEPLDLSYSEFLDFCFNGDLDKFYGSLRWNKWKEEVSTLHGDKVYNFIPYLWSVQGKDINKNDRSVVPAEEQYIFNMSARYQLGLDKK